MDGRLNKSGLILSSFKKIERSTAKALFYVREPDGAKGQIRIILGVKHFLFSAGQLSIVRLNEGRT